jgi:hypothetical protein
MWQDKAIKKALLAKKKCPICGQPLAPTTP